MIVKLSSEFSNHLKEYLEFVRQGTKPSIATYYLGAMTRSFLDERILNFNRRMRSMQLAIVVDKIEQDVEIMCDLTKQACQELCKEVNRTFLMTLIRALYTHIREEVGTSSQGFSSDESMSSISKEAFAPLHMQIKVITDDINRGIIKDYVNV